jgi:hypothetical protein
LVGLSLGVLAAARQDQPSATSSPAEDVISFFMLLVALAAFAFEVIALVWLLRLGKQPVPYLPEEDG